MKFSDSLVAKLADQHLLKHEFYQAWSTGSIPLETLRLYAQQYYHHVKAFPRYISAIHSQCEKLADRQVLLENLNDEEKGTENHPELWLRFAEGLGETRSHIEEAALLPETQALVEEFFNLTRESYASGLGTLFAYEHQIPEISTFKIDALKKYYAVDGESALAFFKVHERADIYHSQALGQLLDQLSPEEKEIAEKSTRVAATHLWKFLDGIQRTL